MDKSCTVCDKKYSAKRSTSKFCSGACRVKFSRDIKDDPIIKLKRPTLSQSETNEKNEWFNSAENKTQEEIEAHYTLKNFPSKAKYYSSGGGGSGAVSPYPRYNRKSLAYIDAPANVNTTTGEIK